MLPQRLHWANASGRGRPVPLPGTEFHLPLDTLIVAIGERPDTVVFFQIPNARYVLCDVAFWDIYYEHCSYFTKGSLARLFRQAGFEVRDGDAWRALDLSMDPKESVMLRRKAGSMPSSTSPASGRCCAASRRRSPSPCSPT